MFKTLDDFQGASGVMMYAPRLDINHPLDHGENGAAFDFNGCTYFQYEDPDDGYRSYAGMLLACGELRNVSFNRINERVICRMTGGEGEVLEFLSLENNLKPIFRIGTDYSDSYYPLFTCHYLPENLSANMGKTDADN